MKLGFTQVYNDANWIGYAIDQAMKVCDKLLIVEGSNFMYFKNLSARSDDGTLDIISDKMKEYPKRIEVWPDGSNTGSHRGNQCANHQAALERCKTGDYFIPFDTDEFYMDSFIDDMNEAMRDGKIDRMDWTGLQFLFGFRWVFAEQVKKAFLKKVPGAYFTPLHIPNGFGNRCVTIGGVSCLHYCWVKTRERMLRRARIGIYDGMPKWFALNYDRIKLAEGEKIDYVDNQVFTLKEYRGTHPSVLDDHPWRHIEDMRKVKI